VDEQQQQRVNAAGEEFAHAMVESQRAMADRGISAQEMNAQLTQQFFNSAIDTLQRQAQENRVASQELSVHTQRAQEAARALTQEGSGAYMDFMNSLFDLSERAVQQGAEETRKGV
jgi:NADH/NAD ratio-sensing transcriptional regulator Rex